MTFEGRHNGLRGGKESGHATPEDGVRALLEIRFTRREMGIPMRSQGRPQTLERELHESSLAAVEAAARGILHSLEHPPTGLVGPATILSWSLTRSG